MTTATLTSLLLLTLAATLAPLAVDVLGRLVLLPVVVVEIAFGVVLGPDALNLVEDDAVKAEIQRAVDEANKAVSKAEAIRKFTILKVDWTEEGGQMTPSLKLKRSVVMKQYTDTVEELYVGTNH